MSLAFCDLQPDDPMKVVVIAANITGIKGIGEHIGHALLSDNAVFEARVVRKHL